MEIPPTLISREDKRKCICAITNNSNLHFLDKDKGKFISFLKNLLEEEVNFFLGGEIANEGKYAHSEQTALYERLLSKENTGMFFNLDLSLVVYLKEDGELFAMNLNKYEIVSINLGKFHLTRMIIIPKPDLCSSNEFFYEDTKEMKKNKYKGLNDEVLCLDEPFSILIGTTQVLVIHNS
jgi:hypothetical protein